ncbi:MAG: hypothetical protein V1874_11505 [Spirochaetota bacterium]
MQANNILSSIKLENDIYEIKLREEDEQLKNREYLITKKEASD